MARSSRKKAGNYFRLTATSGKDPPETPVKEKVYRRKKEKGINASPVLPPLADQANLNTPFKDKPAGNPLRPGTQPMKTGYTQSSLELELDEEIVYDAHAEDLLANWFPEDRLPLSVDAVLLGLAYTDEQLKLGKPESGVYYNADSFEWANFPLDHEKFLPKGSTVEDELAKYMQAVADFSAKHLTRDPDAVRKCTGKYSNLHLKSDVSGIRRKPDVLWVDQDVRIVSEDTAEDDDDDDEFNADGSLRHLNWKFIASFGEIKLLKWKLRGTTFIQKFGPEINDRMFAIFEAQDNRCYVPSFAANGVLFRLCHSDRGGTIYSTEFNIFAKPRNFVHLIVGLAYASDECIGYDPTILRKPVEKTPGGPSSLENLLPLNDAEMERLADTIEGLEIPRNIPIPSVVPTHINVASSSGLSPTVSPNRHAKRRLRPRNNITAPARTPTFTTNASSKDAEQKKKRRRKKKKKKKKAPILLSGCPRLAAIDTEDNYIRYIVVAGYLYEIRGSVYRRVMIQGRATQCWLVVRDGKEYIIVDKWVSPYRIPTEVDLLLLAQGIAGVPKLVDWEDVTVGGCLDTCVNNRGVHLKLINRVHRRMVLEDFCKPIYFFHSLRELVSAFRDYLITHKGLYLINILHRDITIFNLLLKASGAKLRQGVLADYDYAWDDDEVRRLNYKIPEVGKSNLPDKVLLTKRVNLKAVDSKVTSEILEVSTPATVEPESASIIGSKSVPEGDPSVQGPSSSKQTSLKSATLRREEELEKMIKRSKDISHSVKGDRTGMRLFISGELLDDRTIKPTIRHDFESFEYNLLFLSFMFKGPDDDQIETGLPPILKSWIHAEKIDEETAAFSKKGWFGQSEESLDKKLYYVTPYMRPLIPLLKKIHFFLSGPRENINHDSFIKIFDWALDELDLDGEKPAASDSEPHESTDLVQSPDPSDPGPSSLVPGAPETQQEPMPTTSTSTFPMPLVPRNMSAVAYPNVWVPVRIPLPIHPVSVRQSRHYVHIFDDQQPETDD